MSGGTASANSSRCDCATRQPLCLSEKRCRTHLTERPGAFVYEMNTEPRGPK
jgi:hypothetical protein